MADTGILPVTSYSDIDGIWANESYILADDSNWAYCAQKKNQQYELACYFSGLDLPSGATINGVEITAIAKVNYASITMYANLINDTPAAIGTARGVTFAAINTEYTKVFGGSTTTWSVSDWSGFVGCWVYFTHNSSTSYIGYLDYLSMKVWYTAPLKTVQGIAIASVQKVNGLAIASMRSVNGIRR